MKKSSKYFVYAAKNDALSFTHTPNTQVASLHRRKFISVLQKQLFIHIIQRFIFQKPHRLNTRITTYAVLVAEIKHFLWLFYGVKSSKLETFFDNIELDLDKSIRYVCTGCLLILDKNKSVILRSKNFRISLKMVSKYRKHSTI